MVKVKLLSENAKMPTKGHIEDAGTDLYLTKDVFLIQNQQMLVSLDIAVAIPNGFCGLILPRSSASSKGLHVFTGVIDSGYRGPIKVNVLNLSGTLIDLKKGDRIAQLVIVPVSPIGVTAWGFEQADSLDETERGAGGFGSTGN